MRPLLRRPPWRDGYWIQPELGASVPFAKVRFPRSVPLMPANRRLLRFEYVSWMLLLCLYLLARYVLFFYMSSHVFSSVQGMPLELPPTRLAKSEIQLLSSGVPLYDRDGRTIIDSRLDSFHVVTLSGDGKLGFDNDSGTAAAYVEGLCQTSPVGRRVVVLVPKTTSSYQQVITGVDAIAGAMKGGCDLALFLGAPSDITAATTHD